MKKDIKKLPPTASNIFLAGAYCAKDLRVKYMLLRAAHKIRIQENAIDAFSAPYWYLDSKEKEFYMKIGKERWKQYKNICAIINQLWRYTQYYDIATGIEAHIDFTTKRIYAQTKRIVNKPRILLRFKDGHSVTIPYFALKKYLLVCISNKMNITDLQVVRVNRKPSQSFYVTEAVVGALIDSAELAETYEFTESDKKNILRWPDL